MRYVPGTPLLHLLAIVGIGAACAPTSLPPLADPQSSPALVAALAACWRFSPPRSDEPHLPPDLIVRLDTSRADTFAPNRLRLVVDTPLGARDRLGGWGLLQRPNQVFAFWGDGFTGLRLHLTLHEDTLRGHADRTVDYPMLRSAFPVTATRTACPNGL